MKRPDHVAATMEMPTVLRNPITRSSFRSFSFIESHDQILNRFSRKGAKTQRKERQMNYFLPLFAALREMPFDFEIAYTSYRP